MLIYIFFYAFIYMLYGLGLILKSEKPFYVAIFFVIIFVSIRYMVGWDYEHYYNAVAFHVDNNITMRGEYLTILVVELSRYFEAPLLYFSINALVLFFSMCHFIKKYSVNYWLSFFIFLGFPLFFLNSLSVVRIFSAVAIVIFAVDYLTKNKLSLYFFLVLIASFFHKSAVFAFIFPVFLFYKPSRQTWIFLIVLAPFFEEIIKQILLFVVDSYLPIYSTYLKPTDVQEGTRAIYVFLVVAVAMIVMKNRVVDNNKLELFYHVYLFGVFFYCIFISYGTLGHRLSLYSTIFMVILLPKLVTIFKPIIFQYGITTLIHLAFLIFFFLTIYIGNEAYIPYQTIFSGVQ